MVYKYIMSSPETPNVSTPESTIETPTESTIETPTFSTSGRVKWFNNKAGYGFITVTSGSQTDEDVFVHHSAIVVDHEQYRYLVQGEYVNFTLCSVEDESHKWQAGTVKGINNGKLMCETRLESRIIRDDSENTKKQSTRTYNRETHARDNTDSTHYRIRSRGPGPREGDEWMLVRRREPKYVSSPKRVSSSHHASSSQHDVLRSRQSKPQ